MNVLDSELVQGQLEALGYGFTSELDDAGVVLLNTCSVRELSEQKVWSQLGRLGVIKREERPELVVGVLGCMAEREAKGIFERMPHVDLVCGPSMLNKVPTLVDNAVHNSGERQVALTGHIAR
ncbi:MAG: tRNA (N6-isopentenyl adenosine(37)-C2)-methylthiotransferase MiaB, partial [Myxococcota bacterium]